MTRAACTVAVLLTTSAAAWAQTAAAPDATSLVESLKDDRAKVRAQAALALAALVGPGGEIPGVPVVEALTFALGDEEAIVRGAAARALGTVLVPATYPVLLAATRDEDPFVAKQAGWAVRRLVGAADRVDIGIRGVRCRSSWKADVVTNAVQAEVLRALLETQRFVVTRTLSFDDEEGADPTLGAAEERPLVRLEVTADGSVAGRKEQASAALTMKVLAEGFVVWQGRAAGAGVGGPPPPTDEEVDEYTIRDEGPDARLAAATDLGKAAARALLDGLAAAALEKPLPDKPDKRGWERARAAGDPRSR